MATPVVVSRIQNRRGTKAQFDALYPVGYQGTGFLGSPRWRTTPAPFSTINGNGEVVTITISASNLIRAPIVGSTIVVQGVAPAVYNKPYSITTVTEPAVGIIVLTADDSVMGVMTTPGSISLPYVIENYPNILQPGELALCMDSRSIFMGNDHGEYIKISVNESSLNILPLTLLLEPAATPTLIPALSYDAVNFFTLFYDVTDSPPDFTPPDTTAGALGVTFTKNGQMNITAMTFIPTVNLVDVCNELNLRPEYDISFSAQFDNNTNPTKIQIFYQHNFPGTLTFSTASLQWL